MYCMKECLYFRLPEWRVRFFFLIPTLPTYLPKFLAFRPLLPSVKSPVFNFCPYVFIDMTYISLPMEQQLMGVLYCPTQNFFKVCLQCSLKKLAPFFWSCLFVTWSSWASTRLVFMKLYMGEGGIFTTVSFVIISHHL